MSPERLEMKDTTLTEGNITCKCRRLKSNAAVDSIFVCGCGPGITESTTLATDELPHISGIKSGGLPLSDSDTNGTKAMGFQLDKKMVSGSSYDIPGSSGFLVSLKTTLEARSSDRVLEVYVTVISPKEASIALNMIRKLIPDDSGLDLQHLRRFAKYTDVPESIRLLFEAKKMEYDQSHEVDMPSEAPSKLFLVVGSVNAISRTTLVDALSAIAKNIVLFTAHVPMLAPTSQKQATQWTSQYWPTVYKKSNPFGPHPSIVARAEEEIRGDVQKWMDLADKVAQESRQSDSGEAVGVVIVDRKDGNARPVAVAGDARWFGWPRCGAGNVTAHAALRAIAMVAARLRPEEQATGSENSQVEKFDKTISDNHDEFDVDASVTTAASVRLLGKSSLPTRKTSTNVNEQVGGLIEDLPRNKGDENADHDIVPKKDGIFQDRPLFTIEAQNHPQSNNGDGYLCHGLEIYCSHEPCVMCSMAIVHSRFGKIVFARRMHETGGLCADGQLGHGLFWRKELNWTMLAWQWFDSMHTDAEVTPALFHA